MEIRVACPNGHKLKVSEKFAGKKVACPKCKAPLTIPMPEAAVELEALEADPLGAAMPDADPLAAGTGTPQQDWLGADLGSTDLAGMETMPTVPATSPLVAATMNRTAAQPTPTPRSAGPAAGSRKFLLIGIASGGALFLIAAIVVASWMLFGGKKEVASGPPATGTNSTAPSNPTPPSNSVAPTTGATGTPAGGAAASVAVSSPAGKTETVAPSEPPPLSVWELAEPATAFALNPETGDLAAICAQTTNLYVYPAAEIGKAGGKVVGPVKSGRVPVSVAFKRFGQRALFIVADIEDPVLRVFAADKLEPAGEIKVAVPRVSMVATDSRADSPFIFYSAWDAERSSFHTYRADLSNMTDSGIWSYENFSPVVSARGTYLYSRNMNQNSALAFWNDEVAAHPSMPRLYRKQLGGAGDSGKIIPDTHEQYALAAFNLFTADLSKLVKKLGFRCECFLDGRPLVAGLNESGICIASLNSLETVGLLTLPEGVLPVPPGRRPPGEPPPKNSNLIARTNELRQTFSVESIYNEVRLIPDMPRERMLVVHAGRGVVVTLDRFKLPKEPLLAAFVDGPRQITYGESFSAKVQVPPSVAVTLSDAPNGMKLDGDTLTWTPTTDQVGEMAATLYLSSAQHNAQQAIRILVKRPSIACSFPAKQVVSRDDGKMAVAMGWFDLFKNGVAEPVKETKLALLDLENRKIVVESSFEGPVSRLAIDSHYVYLMGKDPPDLRGQLHVLSNKDLTPVKQMPIRQGMRDQNGRGFLTELKPFADNYLISDKLYSLPALTPMPNSSVNGIDEPISTKISACLFARHGEFWLFDGLVYDNTEFKDVRMIYAFRPFSEMRYALGSDETIQFTWTDQAWYASPEVRMLGGLPVRIEAKEAEDGVSLTAHTFEYTQKILAKWPIGPGKFSEGNRSQPGLSVTQSAAIVVVNGLVYFTQLEKPKDIPEPPHFEPHQNRFAFSSKTPTKLEYRIRGGKPPYRQIHAGNEQLIEGGFVSQDGIVEIEIDPTKQHPAYNNLREIAPNILVQELQRAMGRQRNEPIAKSAKSKKANQTNQAKDTQLDLLDLYKENVGTLLRTKLGAKPPRGIAAPVNLITAAIDADGKKFKLAHWMFIEVPEEEVRARLR